MTEDRPAPARPRRRRFSKRFGYVAIAVLLVVLGLISTNMTDVVLNPWARSLTGAPLLTGTWQGELRLPADDVRPVILHLEREPYRPGKCSGCTTIKGSAQVCGAGGAPEPFTIRGKARNWRGTRFYVDTQAGERPPGVYVSLDRLEGEWDRDTIRLRTTVRAVTINPDGSATTTSDSASPDPEVSVDLHRTDADPQQPLNCRP
jgi:hypothetical protein